MADHAQPTNSSAYSDYTAELRGRLEDLAKALDPVTATSVTNPPTNSVRWSSAAGYWEKFNGSVWAALAATYNISVSSLGGYAAALYAKLASPTFTGTPAAPTAAADTTTTQLATTAFVVGQASAASPLMNGTVAVGTSKKYSRQDHVHPVDTSRAPLASPTFTGTPAAPTAAPGTNTTQLATAAFVTAAVAAVDLSAKMDKASNLSDVANAATARANLVVPTRTGGDASGTWGINITGSAASATTAGSCSGNAATATTATTATNNVLKDNGVAVGTYALGKPSTGTIAVNATTAGFESLNIQIAGDGSISASRTAMTGTWRNVGADTTGTSGGVDRYGIHQRIA